MQIDAYCANVALTRPIRVPDVWAASSRVLGTTRQAVRRLIAKPFEEHLQNAYGNKRVIGSILGNSRPGCFEV